MYDIPKTLNTRFIAVGGLNRFGEPNYRVVWGQTRLTWIGGERAIQDVNGNETGHVTEERQVPRVFSPLIAITLRSGCRPSTTARQNRGLNTRLKKWTASAFPTSARIPRAENTNSPCASRKKMAATHLLDGAESAVVELIQMIKRGECISKTENWLAIKRHEEKKDREWNTSRTQC